MHCQHRAVRRLARRCASLALTLLGLALASCANTERPIETPPAFQTPMVGRPAPELDIREWVVDPGADHRTQEKLPLMLVFWNFTDPASREAIEMTQSLAVPLRHRGLRVVLIHTDIGTEEKPRRGRVTEFLDEHGFMLPTAIDNGTATLRQFQLTDVPSMVFIDEASIIRGVVSNYRVSKNDVIAEFVRANLLGMPPALPEM
ncbi:MAG: TlpA disulfide reductase family protein [bacterium]